jgi:hypothetical protein
VCVPPTAVSAAHLGCAGRSGSQPAGGITTRAKGLSPLRLRAAKRLALSPAELDPDVFLHLLTRPARDEVVDRFINTISAHDLLSAALFNAFSALLFRFSASLIRRLVFSMTLVRRSMSAAAREIARFFSFTNSR